ncbi:MAG: glycoside hydrolase family 88 protein, partial [Bacteroidales bacterium]|nr:glycoside hydrolase family 88 protein [Bacteroidales bacterium]
MKQHFLWITGLTLSIATLGGNHKNWNRDEVITLVRKVNDRWQSTHPEPGNAFWHTAAYHTGNMAAYEVTQDERYCAYSEAWAEHNQWKGAKSDDKSQWKYRYGETDDHVLFGDWQICFQTYIDLYRLQPDDRKIARAREVMEYEMSTPNNDYWWWADGLYMVMPVMTKLHKVTGNALYLQKLYAYFSFAKNLMYDEEAGLFYRDAKYIYPKHKTKTGKKEFWSRGNGWVFAGLAKVLQDLPETNVHHPEYAAVFRTMAKALKNSQQADGHWTRSLLDESQAPGYETSGTAFFTYGFLWGINNGILERDEYEETIQKSWKYLTEIALQPDGTVGYAQPIGERADQHNNVNERSTADFGVGAFLLAACEKVKSIEKIKQDSLHGIAQKRVEVKDMSAYLLTYFKDDTHSLYFAVSDDGYTFTDVNGGKPVIAGDTIATQRGIRDPHVTRGKDGAFYLAMTDLHIYGKEKGYRTTRWERDEKYGWGNNRGFVLMKSFDLIQWTRSNVIVEDLFPDLDVACAWAPESIYDPETDKMMLYFTMRIGGKGKTKLYYAYTDDDFTTLVSRPQSLFNHPDSTFQILDADITRLSDGEYVMFYVSQENPAGIKMAKSKHINRDYTYESHWVDFESGSCEAPNLWKRIGENKWVLMYDIFSIRPHNFGFAETNDFKKFTNIGRFDEGAMKRSNFEIQKH